MDKLKDIDVVLDEIINEHDNLDELGTNELREILKELKGLGTQIASAYTNPIPGVKVIVEEGKTDKYQIEENVTFDLNELIAISEYGKELVSKFGNFEDKLNSRLAARKALYEQKYDRRRALENEINLRNESIAFFKKEIADIKSVLENPDSDLDDIKTFYYEKRLHEAENSLKIYETELGFYENEIKEVKNEMEILVYGGILPEKLMDDELDSNETLDETKVVENNDELEDNVAAILTNENEEKSNAIAEEIEKQTEIVEQAEENESKIEKTETSEEIKNAAEEQKEIENKQDVVQQENAQMPTHIDVMENDQVEETPMIPKNKGNKPKLTWKTAAAVAAGIGIGAGVYFAAGPLGVTVMSVAGTFAKKVINKKISELEQERIEIIGSEQEITIKEPEPGLKGAWDKFKTYIKSEEGLRDMKWLINSAIITGVGLSIGSAIQNMSNAPTTEVIADSAPGYEDIVIGENVEGLNVSTGHDTASWAINGQNTEQLIPKYVNENSIIKRFAQINPDNTMTMIDTKGLSLGEYIAQTGADPSKIAVDIANKDGVSQAWEVASDLLRETGGPRL